MADDTGNWDGDFYGAAMRVAAERDRLRIERDEARQETSALFREASEGHREAMDSLMTVIGERDAARAELAAAHQALNEARLVAELWAPDHDGFAVILETIEAAHLTDMAKRCQACGHSIQQHSHSDCAACVAIGQQARLNCNRRVFVPPAGVSGADEKGSSDGS